NAKNFMSIKFDGNSKNLSIQALTQKRVDFDLNPVQAREYFVNGDKELKINNFPISNIQTGNLILKYQNPIVDNNLNIKIKTKNGIIDLKIEPLICYYGTIEGQENSDVFLTYSS